MSDANYYTHELAKARQIYGIAFQRRFSDVTLQRAICATTLLDETGLAWLGEFGRVSYGELGIIK